MTVGFCFFFLKVKMIILHFKLLVVLTGKMEASHLYFVVAVVVMVDFCFVFLNSPQDTGVDYLQYQFQNCFDIFLFL